MNSPKTIASSRSTRMLTLAAVTLLTGAGLAACGGGGSSDTTTSTTTGTTTGASTAGVLCDYSSSAFNSSPSVNATAT
jgi:hypothetical protein